MVHVGRGHLALVTPPSPGLGAVLAATASSAASGARSSGRRERRDALTTSCATRDRGPPWPRQRSAPRAAWPRSACTASGADLGHAAADASAARAQRRVDQGGRRHTDARYQRHCSTCHGGKCWCRPASTEGNGGQPWALSSATRTRRATRAARRHRSRRNVDARTGSPTASHLVDFPRRADGSPTAELKTRGRMPFGLRMLGLGIARADRVRHMVANRSEWIVTQSPPPRSARFWSKHSTPPLPKQRVEFCQTVGVARC